MSKPALQISIADPELQAYLQRHPFAAGPDPARNEAGRRAVAASLAERAPAPPAEPEMLPLATSGLPTAEQAAADRLLEQIHVDAATREVYRNDFAWEANLLPRFARNVLVIGCGDGVELIFLRAVLPQARLTGIDYHCSLLPGLADAVGVTFLEGDMNRHLLSLAREYDLIFSNHTLEHLYEPDRILALLASLLLPSGHLVSVLPMTGREGMPFLDRARAIARSHSIHPVDMPLVDAGHPWKTSPADLKQTLEGAGLTGVKLYQRAGRVSRPLRRSARMYRTTRALAVGLNTLLIGPLRLMLKIVFPRRVPEPAVRLLFALERRVPFGTNRVMNNYSEEALVIGRRAD
jgi:SAM-dependent methyltransferase